MLDHESAPASDWHIEYQQSNGSAAVKEAEVRLSPPPCPQGTRWNSLTAGFSDDKQSALMLA